MSEDEFIVYKTTCLISNKYYIGVHKKGICNGRYLGSGKALKLAIKKYGRENFIRETLYSFPTQQEAYDKEKEIVNETTIKDPMCYNICGGGYGTGSGTSHPNYGKKLPQTQVDKMSASRSGKKSFWYGRGELSHFYGKYGKDSNRYGIPHTQESKKKMSVSTSGENNPHFGKYGKDHPSSICRGENNHMFGKYGKDNPNYGRKHTQESKDLQSKVKCKKCSCEGIIYESGIKASEGLTLSRSVISKRCRNPKYPTYFYI